MENYIRHIYRDDLIIEYGDGSLIAFAKNKDDDIDTFETHSLEKAQQWLDKFNNSNNRYLQ